MCFEDFITISLSYMCCCCIGVLLFHIGVWLSCLWQSTMPYYVIQSGVFRLINAPHFTISLQPLALSLFTAMLLHFLCFIVIIVDILNLLNFHNDFHFEESSEFSLILILKGLLNFHNDFHFDESSEFSQCWFNLSMRACYISQANLFSHTMFNSFMQWFSGIFNPILKLINFGTLLLPPFIPLLILLIYHQTQCI